MLQSNLVFCLLGPTASGKTALACELVQSFPLEIISVDSAMIYKEMNIGTAKPSMHELTLAPHHLINIIEPIDSYSAAQFCDQAHTLCQSIISKGKIPLLVGGTMMYFNAFQQGLSLLPERDPQICSRIEEEAALYDWNYIHQKLTQIDPTAAERIHAHDTQRIQRALEVYYQTGMTLTSLLAEQKQKCPYRFVNLALFPQQRDQLHARIAARFMGMLEQGFIEEVQQLQKKWSLHLNLASMRCVGYRQVFEYLQGAYDYALMCDKAIAATRQLAKRQLTWLRSWDHISLYDEEQYRQKINATVGKILDRI